MDINSALDFCRRFAEGDHTAEEHAQFLAWLAKSPEQDVHMILEEVRQLAVAPRHPDTADPALVLRIEALLNERASQPFYVRHRRVIGFSVAAAVLLFVFGLWEFLSVGSKPTATNMNVAASIKNDVPPGGDKAVLTLADGSTIVLDSMPNGQIAMQGNSTVTRSGGQISYANQGNSAGVVYNIMTTPRGGQYRLVLADGTVAWLNSASSLRFPTSFAGGQREVELTGEGYFEVAPDKSKPFKVHTGDQTVNVLGTDFNIMAYPEESAIRTTLVSGSIRVEQGKLSALLSPGKQAVLSSGKFQTQAADLETTLAWKNGRFEFEDTDIKTIMRQLERWYAIKVAYQGDVSSIVLSGSVSRRKTVVALLDILAETGRFHFSIEGDLITIRP